jgi:[protein-PII] uridylyltransferase
LLKTIAEADSLGTLVPVVEWHDDLNLDLTVVNIVTWDRAGLFYKLAGSFSLAGLNIISSKALTRADHITIDTFYVTDSDGGFVSSKKAFEVFQMHLKDALLHNKDLMPELEKKSRSQAQPSYLQRQEHLPADIPAKVDIYHELSLRRTIIEVQCNDAIGLLYRLTKAIYDHGFDITFGRISTERHVVADTFYIEPIQPNSKGDASPILELRKSLEEIVQSIGQS